jgi:tRNA(Arg) A34 adenosine deaminase TadA
LSDNPTDHDIPIRAAIDVALAARAHGNHPFGSVLAINGRIVLEAENTVVTESDPTGHAETNLVRLAAQKFSDDQLGAATLYTSTEPCPMCSGAIYWAGIRRVVYSMPAADLELFAGPSLLASCTDVFDGGAEPTEVIGPIHPELGRTVHEGFWT